MYGRSFISFDDTHEYVSIATSMQATSRHDGISTEGIFHWVPSGPVAGNREDEFIVVEGVTLHSSID